MKTKTKKIFAAVGLFFAGGIVAIGAFLGIVLHMAKGFGH